jgi:hypothetical protein
VAVVEVDGGRLGTRQVGAGPGVHQPQHQEDKIACLISMAASVHPEDPQLEPPPSFVEPRRVQRLVQEIKSQSVSPDAGADAVAPAADRPGPAEPWAGAPPPQVRTCVASMARSRMFGPMVAAEAPRRDCYQAARGAFVADGLPYNWKIWRGYFRHFEPIVDFLHLLCYVYLAAYAAGPGAEDPWSR